MLAVDRTCEFDTISDLTLLRGRLRASDRWLPVAKFTEKWVL